MTTPPRRLVTPEKRDDDADLSLRPLALADFTGQEAARKNLRVFIEAAKTRGEALDHVLFVGPPGLGKTTLAQIVARELGVNFRSTSGPVIAKAGDLAAQLTNLEPRDVLFIDEIHRLNPAIEEILYPAMEDFQLDLIIGAGPAARSVKIDLAKFTLVGATTRAGLLTTPLRDRFGIPVRLNFYTIEELELIVTRGARVLGVAIREDGAREIARRSRGTPRIAGRLLRRVRDFAVVEGAERVTRELADRALTLLEVDSIGLDEMDRRYLDMVAVNFGGGPVGHRDHRGGAVGAARRDRGHHRAVPAAAGILAAHAARAPADAARLPTPRPRRACAGPRAVRVVRGGGGIKMTPTDSRCLTVRTLEEADKLMAQVRESAARAHEWIKSQADPLEMLRAMKFQPVGRHPIETDRRLNFIEQVNQTWTFAVAIAAARQLLALHPDAGGFKLAPGAHASLPLDIMSEKDRLVGAETFAAVTPRNNGKLATDLKKLSNRHETHRYVFFAAPNFPGNKRRKELEEKFEHFGIQELKSGL